MTTIELRLDDRALDRARRLARTRRCPLERVFEDEIEKMPLAETHDDRFLGMFSGQPELIDEVTRSAMKAREHDSLRAPRQ